MSKESKCLICGAPLTGKQQKYCSKKCYNKSRTKKRESHKEKRRAQNRAYYHRKKNGIEREVFEEPLWLEPTCEDCLYYDECGGTKKGCEYRV